MSHDERAEASDEPKRPKFYERQYLVDKPFQHRLVGTLLGVWIANSVFFTLVLYFFYEGHLNRFYELVPRDGMLPLLTLPALFGSAIAFVALFGLVVTGVISMYVSNQIAGPLWRTRKYLERVGEGDWNRTLQFRFNDFLRDIPDVFNGMLAKLRAGAQAELAELERIERENDPARMKQIARALREKKEAQLGLREENGAGEPDGEPAVPVAVH